MARSWILVGMMGAGKSSLGRALAEDAGRTFVDTDQLVQRRLGRPIAQIFQIYGEPTFREHETSVLRSLRPGPDVVSTGGGIVGRPENWDAMRALGPTLYLRARPETLIERLALSKKKRPLLQVDAWEDEVRAILARREPLYAQADLTVDVDEGGIADDLDHIRSILEAAG